MLTVNAFHRRVAQRGGEGGPVYRLVQTEPAPIVLPRLDPTQQAVVDHPGGPLLVLAGPGTGKTTTIVEAVAARIDAGNDPEQILVLTFSRKAAAELRTRITSRVARTIREPLARTFHSYAFRVLRRAAILRGDPPPPPQAGPAALGPPSPTSSSASPGRDRWARCRRHGC